MAAQQFCLRWNNHQTNLLSIFDKLLLKESFVDVTLACEGKSIKAHKVVLSACSPFFEEILENNPCKHPVIILKDMQYVDLKAIVQFMYKGEVNISQEQLSQLIRTAEALKIKGLAEMGSDDQSQPEPPRSPPPPKQSQQNQHIQAVKRKRDNQSPISTPRQFPNKNVSNQNRQPTPESHHSSQNLPPVHESPSFANIKFSRVNSNSPHQVERPAPSQLMSSNIPHKRIETNLQSSEFTNSPEIMTPIPQNTIIKREPTPPPAEPEEPVEPNQSEFLMDPTCDQDLNLEPDYDSRTSQNEFKSELQYEEVNLSDSPPPDLPMGMTYNETSVSGNSSMPTPGTSSQLDNSNGDQLTDMAEAEKYGLRSKSKRKAPEAGELCEPVRKKKKTQAEYQREYRARIKANPELYKLHKAVENDRIKSCIANLTEEKKAKYRETTRIRVQKFRENAATTKRQPKKVTPPKTREAKEKQRKKWREQKAAEGIYI